MSPPTASSSVERLGMRWFAPVVVLALAALTVLSACSEEARDEIAQEVNEATSPDDGGSTGDGTGTGGGDDAAGGDTDDGGDTGDGGDSGEAAQPTAPPATPAPEQPAPPDGTEEGLSSEDWLVLIVLGALAVVIVIAAAALATERQQRKDAAKAARAGHINQLVGGSRWVHDQGSIDVLRVNDPPQLARLWASVRARIVELEGQVAVMAAGVSDQQLYGALTHLGQSLAGLRGALESNVAIRLDPAAVDQEALLASSTQVVYDRRRELQAATVPLSMMR